MLPADLEKSIDDSPDAPQVVPQAALAQAQQKPVRRAIAVLRQAEANRESQESQESQVLSALLVEEKEEQKEDLQQASIKIEEIEKLRNTLRTVMAKETPQTKNLCDEVFKIQLILAEHWPINPVENNEPIDELDSSGVIPPPSRLASASGRLFHKQALEDYFSRSNAFQINKNTIEILDPLTHEPFSSRELAYFEEKGVKIPKRDLRLHDNVLLARDLGDNVRQVNDSRIIIILNTILKDTVVGMVLGSLLGGSFGFGLLLPLMIFIAFSSPISFVVILAVGVLYGLHEFDKYGTRFFQAMAVGIMAATVLAALIYLGPLIVAGLVSASIISATSAAMVSLIWPLAQALIPIVGIAFASLGEAFKPDFMRKTFTGLCKAWLVIPVAIGCISGGLTGFFISAGVSMISSVFSLCRRSREELAPRPGDAAQVEIDGLGAARRPELSQGANLQRVLGQERIPRRPPLPAEPVALAIESKDEERKPQDVIYQSALNDSDGNRREASLPSQSFSP